MGCSIEKKRELQSIVLQSALKEVTRRAIAMERFGVNLVIASKKKGPMGHVRTTKEMHVFTQLRDL